jgi:hypothetical protein
MGTTSKRIATLATVAITGRTMNKKDARSGQM